MKSSAMFSIFLRLTQKLLQKILDAKMFCSPASTGLPPQNSNNTKAKKQITSKRMFVTEKYRLTQNYIPQLTIIHSTSLTMTQTIYTNTSQSWHKLSFEIGPLNLKIKCSQTESQSHLKNQFCPANVMCTVYTNRL